MDRLAREGARFANAFTVTSVCSPSRASYLTGRHGIEVGITDYIDPLETGVGLPVGVETWLRGGAKKMAAAVPALAIMIANHP